MMYVIGGIVILVGLVIYLVSIIIPNPSDEKIIEALREEGYECKKEEGLILMKRKNCNWRIICYDLNGKKRRRVYLDTGFEIGDHLKSDHAMMNRITCIVGENNPHVSVTWDGESGIHFVFVTVVRSSSELLNDFGNGFNAMDQAIGEYFELSRQAEEMLGHNGERKVGFDFGGHEEPSKEEVMEVRAEEK